MACNTLLSSCCSPKPLPCLNCRCRRRATTSSTGSTRKVGRHTQWAAPAALPLCCCTAGVLLSASAALQPLSFSLYPVCKHIMLIPGPPCSPVGGNQRERGALRSGNQGGGAGEAQPAALPAACQCFVARRSERPIHRTAGNKSPFPPPCEFAIVSASAAVGLLLRLQQRDPAPARDGAPHRALQVRYPCARLQARRAVMRKAVVHNFCAGFLFFPFSLCAGARDPTSGTPAGSICLFRYESC